uniref:C2 domain-containing protein n=1 Tax=Chenopodium quinoa TaxID=63459 RepID=A0A803L541_CHEQI
MNTYVVGWVNPNRKLITRVDHKGNNSPEWNDRFIFRVSPEFLESNTSTVELEIYCQTWLRDTLVGFVRVAVPNLLPTDSPNGLTRRSVALQIRRPSGRPQGILNVVVSVLDGARRSMPLSGIGTTDNKGNYTISHKPNPEDSIILRRAKSERSWAAMADQEPRAAKSPFKGHDPGPGPGHGQGLRSNEQSEDGIVTKIERWKMEMQKSLHRGGGGRKGGDGARNKHKHRRSKTEGGRLFRCFGKAYGFEFTIVCGSNNGNDKQNIKSGKKKVHHNNHNTSDDESNSQSYIIV